jgi:CheY-like chemotaxis protein
MQESSLKTKSIQSYVRHALEHLYDVDVLAEHWLIGKLGLAQEVARATALRRTLLEAIDRMKPDPRESPETPQWQMYQVLLQRYVQCTQPDSLADQLGISGRQLRRIQNRALAYLAELLIHEGAEEDVHVEAPLESDSDLVKSVKTVDDEIGWLRDAILSEPISLKEVWAEAVQFFAPLAERVGVRITAQLPPDLPPVAIHPTGLRQVILSILNHLVEQHGVKGIVVSASVSTEQVGLIINTVPGGLEAVQSQTRALLTASLGLLPAQRILSIFGGELLEKRNGDGHSELLVRLMTAAGTKILVIDDNPDILQLYHRYVAGTRYQLVVCDEPTQALAVAAAHGPKAVVLDIMMPGIDGWSLLGKLRHHPATAAVPVIISTIVSERGMALALGADDFLKKPVSRAVFLAALDRQVTPTDPVFH